MPPLGAIKRRDLIYFLRKAGFDGPVSGSRHQFMVKGDKSPRIPNPHEGDISEGLLRRILIQAGISREEWENL